MYVNIALFEFQLRINTIERTKEGGGRGGEREDGQSKGEDTMLKG